MATAAQLIQQRTGIAGLQQRQMQIQQENQQLQQAQEEQRLQQEQQQAEFQKRTTLSKEEVRLLEEAGIKKLGRQSEELKSLLLSFGGGEEGARQIQEKYGAQFKVYGGGKAGRGAIAQAISKNLLISSYTTIKGQRLIGTQSFVEEKAEAEAKEIIESGKTITSGGFITPYKKDEPNYKEYYKQKLQEYLARGLPPEKAAESAIDITRMKAEGEGYALNVELKGIPKSAATSTITTGQFAKSVTPIKVPDFRTPYQIAREEYAEKPSLSGAAKLFYQVVTPSGFVENLAYGTGQMARYTAKTTGKLFSDTAKGGMYILEKAGIKVPYGQITGSVEIVGKGAGYWAKQAWSGTDYDPGTESFQGLSLKGEKYINIDYVPTREEFAKGFGQLGYTIGAAAPTTVFLVGGGIAGGAAGIAAASFGLGSVGLFGETIPRAKQEYQQYKWLGENRSQFDPEQFKEVKTALYKNIAVTAATGAINLFFIASGIKYAVTPRFRQVSLQEPYPQSGLLKPAGTNIQQEPFYILRQKGREIILSQTRLKGLASQTMPGRATQLYRPISEFLGIKPIYAGSPTGGVYTSSWGESVISRAEALKGYKAATKRLIDSGYTKSEAASYLRRISPIEYETTISGAKGVVAQEGEKQTITISGVRFRNPIISEFTQELPSGAKMRFRTRGGVSQVQEIIMQGTPFKVQVPAGKSAEAAGTVTLFKFKTGETVWKILEPKQKWSVDVLSSKKVYEVIQESTKESAAKYYQQGLSKQILPRKLKIAGSEANVNVLSFPPKDVRMVDFTAGKTIRTIYDQSGKVLMSVEKDMPYSIFETIKPKVLPELGEIRWQELIKDLKSIYGSQKIQQLKAAATTRAITPTPLKSPTLSILKSNEVSTVFKTGQWEGTGLYELTAGGLAPLSRTASLMAIRENLRLQELPVFQQPITSQIKEQITIPLQIPRVDTIVGSAQISLQVQAQPQQLTQIQVPIITPVQAPISISKNAVSAIPRFDLFDFIPFKTKPKAAMIRRDLLGRLKQAFKVITFKRGKEVEIARGLPEGLAKKRGVKEVLSTLRASFKLKPFGTTMVEDLPYRIPASLFTTAKRDRLRYVQKRELRLKARSEIAEIIKIPKTRRKKTKWF